MLRCRFLLSLGAILAVLATHALAQPATAAGARLAPGLRGRSDDTPRVRRRAARRAATAPRAGTLPNFDNPESTRASALRQSGRFRRRAAPGSSRPISAAASAANRRNARRPETPAPTGIGLAPPLSLTAPGTSPTATLLRSTASGTSARAATVRHDRRNAEACRGAARHARRRAAAQSAGAHSGRHGDRRHRRNRQHHAPDDRLDDAAAPPHRGGGRRVRAARPAHRRVPRSAVASK